MKDYLASASTPIEDLTLSPKMMDESRICDMSPSKTVLNSLATTKQPSIDANTSTPTLKTICDDQHTAQKVIVGLSQMSSATHDQVVPSIENVEENESTLGAVLRSLSTIDTTDPNEVALPSGLYDESSTPITNVPTYTPPFAAWSKRVFEKKRRSDSLSSASSVSIPKRRRLFGLTDGENPVGSVNDPIRLPRIYDTPFLDTLPSASPELAKQRQVRKKKAKVPKIYYQGIHSLLDCDGCPLPFPARAQILIEKQQKSYKPIGISRYAFDESFAESMINDGRGKIGERGFSSTGAKVREVAAIPTEADVARSVIAAAEGKAAAFTSAEKVLGSCRLLEAILVRYAEGEAPARVLQAQCVNKTFRMVIRRSTKLQRMLSKL